MALMSLTDIPQEVVRRMPTGIMPLDLSYGISELLIQGKGKRKEFGLPRGRVSLWSGESGVGKSRLAISVAKKMNAMGGRILIGQGEVRPQEFGQWVGTDVRRTDRFWVSDDNEVEKLAEQLREVRPHLFVYDSVNMLHMITHRTHGKELLQHLRDAVAEVGCHAILIGQLNADLTAKGGTTIPHLVDVTAQVAWFNSLPSKERGGRKLPGVFFIRMLKNRYVGCGPAANGWVGFVHDSEGVQVHESFLDHESVSY